MLAAPTAKTPRAKRALAKRGPLLHENPKQTLLLKGNRSSDLINHLLTDLHTLKQPLSLRFSRKNPDIYPFQDVSSLEFFSDKNDCALLALGSHQKKRPHCLTLLRMFEHKLLDMAELQLQPTTFRTLAQFKNKRKPSIGLKPLLSFQGAAFESPVETEYTLVKSLLLDLFRGADVKQVDVEGLQYVISVTVGDEVDGAPSPLIHLRGYMVSTKRSGSRLPRVELEEMGPRCDFRIGRTQMADAAAMKEAMKRPRGTEERVKKNIETDLMGDKVGRIHVGKQNLKDMQTRKMKGLKRGRDQDVVMGGVDGPDEDEGDEMDVDTKRAKV